MFYFLPYLGWLSSAAGKTNKLIKIFEFQATVKIGDRVNLRIIDVIYNGRHIMLARKMGVGGGVPLS